MPKLRLLMVTHFFDSHRGGVEIVAGRLAREFARLGIEVAWAATDASAPPAIDDEAGLRAVPLAASNITERSTGLPYPLPAPSAFRRILREARESDVVLVHDGLYLTGIAAFLAARLSGKPVVVVQHIGAIPYKNPLLRSLMAIANRIITRPILARADQVVFISEATARYFADLSFRRKPELIFNGVDAAVFWSPTCPEDIAIARRHLGLPDTGEIALFVGRFVEKKGLAVMERLARKRSDIVFAFAGWGPLDPRSWNLANLRVFDKLSGAALAELYRACDVFLLPSTGEGFPLVIQEALACGLPVICGQETAGADASASSMLVPVAIDAGNPDRTAALFETALVSCLRERCAEDARLSRAEWAARRYSWPRAAASHAAILRRLQPPSEDPMPASPSARSPSLQNGSER
ncbi:MAG: glycosyltransferase family 4 protein [Hyphomicrobiales bacterium]